MEEEMDFCTAKTNMTVRSKLDLYKFSHVPSTSVIVVIVFVTKLLKHKQKFRHVLK